MKRCKSYDFICLNDEYFLWWIFYYRYRHCLNDEHFTEDGHCLNEHFIKDRHCLNDDVKIGVVWIDGKSFGSRSKGINARGAY